jgi:hypothetical protein
MQVHTITGDLTYFWQNAAFKSTHVEEKIGIVFGVNADKAVLPLDSGCGPGQPVLDVPEHCSSTKHNMYKMFFKFDFF